MRVYQASSQGHCQPPEQRSCPQPTGTVLLPERWAGEQDGEQAPLPSVCSAPVPPQLLTGPLTKKTMP